MKFQSKELVTIKNKLNYQTKSSILVQGLLAIALQ